MKHVIPLLLALVLFSCNTPTKNGSELSDVERAYIQDLGLLDKDETIILFDRQSDLKTSGNFFTDKRLASYWVDKRDTAKTYANFCFYPDIETIRTRDLGHSMTFASYLEVKPGEGRSFRVYVDGDSTEVRRFFREAIGEWINRNNLKSINNSQ